MSEAETQIRIWVDRWKGWESPPSMVPHAEAVLADLARLHRAIAYLLGDGKLGMDEDVFWRDFEEWEKEGGDEVSSS